MLNTIIGKLLWNENIKEYSKKDQEIYKKIGELWDSLDPECQFGLAGDTGSYITQCLKDYRKFKLSLPGEDSKMKDNGDIRI